MNEENTSMAATIIDSRIFGNIFSTDAMRAVWSDENRTAKYVEIERALAIVQGRLGVIPKEAADEIARNCDIAKIDLDQLRAQTERVGYPVLGVVSQLNALCRDGLGEYCHWGATTQDITDTATVMLIREGLALVKTDLEAISAALAVLSQRYRDTPMIGRSNLQQAIPVTFGYKMAAVLAAVERHRERLAQLAPRVLVGEFGGAFGTLASLGHGAMETQAALMEELDLRAAGDRLAHRARPHRRSRLLPRAGRRHARQDCDGRQAADADRGRRRSTSRSHTAAGRAARCRRSAIRSPALLHPRRRLGGAPARGGADGRDGRRSRALDRAVGDRVDRRCPTRSA